MEHRARDEAREEVREEVADLRRARDRGFGEEGRTKEEQDRAMEGKPLSEDERRRLVPDADEDEAQAGASGDAEGGR